MVIKWLLYKSYECRAYRQAYRSDGAYNYLQRLFRINLLKTQII